MAQVECEQEGIVIIRSGFKRLCDGDPCRAALLNHLLFWIAKKKQKGSDTWFNSEEQIWKELDQTWGLSKTKKEIAHLISQGLIGRRHQGTTRTWHYFFGKEQAEVLKNLCKKQGVSLEKMCLPTPVFLLFQSFSLVKKNQSPHQPLVENNQSSVTSNQSNRSEPTNALVTSENVNGTRPASPNGSQNPSKVSTQVSSQGSLRSFFGNPSDFPQFNITPESIARERKKRQQDILLLSDKEAEVRIPRSPQKFVQEAIDDLIDGDRTDAEITFCIKDLKARKCPLTYPEIAKNMANAILKMRTSIPVASPQEEDPYDLHAIARRQAAEWDAAHPEDLEESELVLV